MKKILFFLSLCLFTFQAKAQVKNNDCINVIEANRLLTGNATFLQDNINGKGNINDFGTQYQNFSGCLLPSSGFVEVQSAWYGLKIKTAGTLAFTITPTGNEDFDFAIFGPNKVCSALESPLRCSYAAPKAPNWYTTGLSASSTYTSEGAIGSGFVKYMNVQAGEFYYLLVNNWSSSQGFSITFNGTATLEGQAGNITSTKQCNTINFQSNASGGLLNEISYVWNFGDGQPATQLNTLANPTYTYANAGTYTATCTINFVNPANTLTLTSTVTINGGTDIPTLNFVNLADAYPYNAPAFALQATPAGGTFQVNGATSTSFNPTALGIGVHQVSYTFTNANNCSNTITQNVTVTPPIPANLIATPVFPFMMQLQWANVEQETGYSIWRSTTQGTAYQQIGTTNANITTFTDNNLVAGQNYYYMVRSFNGTIVSGNSNEATAVATAIENTALNEQTQVFPNPTAGVCTIRLPNAIQGDITYNIADELGKKMVSGKIKVVNNQILLNLSQYNKGVYVLYLQTNKGEIQKKIVVL